MPDAIKPTSVEGYLIRVYDKVEVLDSRLEEVEGRLEALIANERAMKDMCNERMNEVEGKLLKTESSTLGAKEVKTSFTPYLIAFISCLLTVASYILLHFVGIK